MAGRTLAEKLDRLFRAAGDPSLEGVAQAIRRRDGDVLSAGCLRSLPAAIVRALRDAPRACRFHEALGGVLAEERRTELYGAPVDQVTYRWPDLRALLPAGAEA